MLFIVTVLLHLSVVVICHYCHRLSDTGQGREETYGAVKLVLHEHVQSELY
jgi:hypothetical protein